MDEKETMDKQDDEAVAPETTEEAPADAATDSPDAGDATGTEDAPADDAAMDSDASEGSYSTHDIEVLDTLKDLGVNTVYLMGTSFILGVLFTVFVLLVLDFIRRNAEEDKTK